MQLDWAVIHPHDGHPTFADSFQQKQKDPAQHLTAVGSRLSISWSICPGVQRFDWAATQSPDHSISPSTIRCKRFTHRTDQIRQIPYYFYLDADLYDPQDLIWHGSCVHIHWEGSICMTALGTKNHNGRNRIYSG